MIEKNFSDAAVIADVNSVRDLAVNLNLKIIKSWLDQDFCLEDFLYFSLPHFFLLPLPYLYLSSSVKLIILIKIHNYFIFSS